MHSAYPILIFENCPYFKDLHALRERENSLAIDRRPTHLLNSPTRYLKWANGAETPIPPPNRQCPRPAEGRVTFADPTI